MEKIELEYGDGIVIDPCYIKLVNDGFGGNNIRFDALKLEKVLHEGDDGSFLVEIEGGGEIEEVGCDSGRIWLMTAEFDCEVTVDSGLSGHIVLRKRGKGLQEVSIINEDV